MGMFGTRLLEAARGAYIHSAKTVTNIDSHTTCSTGLEVSRWVLVLDSVKDAMLVFKMSYVCDFVHFLLCRDAPACDVLPVRVLSACLANSSKQR